MIFRPVDPITHLSLFLMANNPRKETDDQRNLEDSECEDDSDKEYFEEF